MNLMALGLVIFGLLAWAGRRPARVRGALGGLRAVMAAARGWMATSRRTAASMFEPRRAGLNDTDARAILGVAAGAGRADIDSAYRRLIRVAHPDHGGTVGLAVQLNAARDRLTKL